MYHHMTNDFEQRLECERMVDAVSLRCN